MSQGIRHGNRGPLTSITNPIGTSSWARQQDTGPPPTCTLNLIHSHTFCITDCPHVPNAGPDPGSCTPRAPCGPTRTRELPSNVMETMHGPLSFLSSSAVVHVSAFSVRPKTILAPVWPGDATRLDTPALIQDKDACADDQAAASLRAAAVSWGTSICRP